MSTKSFEEFRGDIKRLLDDRREQGWIFGVCTTLARRSEWELWAVRSVAVVLAFFAPLWTALAYFVLAMIFHETRPGAQRKLTRWARRADTVLEVLLRGLRNIVRNRPGREASTRARPLTPAGRRSEEIEPHRAA